MPRLLFVGNNPATGTYLKDALNGGFFQVEQVSRGLDAITALGASEPDVILIEPPLPDMDALSLCRYIRQAYNVPIVVCSTSSQERDIVQALDDGADDYLVMPVRPVELVARLRAALRRTNAGEESRVSKDRLLAGDLEVRWEEHRAYRKGVPIELSPIEFRLLACLVRESGRVVSHAKLITKVWGPEYVDCRHYLRLYIRYLRSKIGDDPADPKLILSEWGVGYRFQPSAN